MGGLRICFFNRSYAPDWGATGQLLTELAEDLARAGHDVWVIAAPPPLPAAPVPRGLRLFQKEARNGVTVLRTRGSARSPRRFAGRAVNYLSYFASSCLAGLAVPRPDIVVALTDPPIIGLAALMLARRAGARFAFVCQDVFPEVARLVEDFRSAAVDGFLDRVNRFLLARADRVIAVGETMRERLIAEKGVDAGKVTVIHNWADCAAIAPGPKANPLAARLGLADRFVVMHSGNVGLSQGLEILLDAAERLSPHRDISVVIVGDGSTRPALERRARSRGLDNVHFFPYQPRESLALSFAAADVFVISLKVGLAGYIVPSKLYGILAAGRPYVAAVEDATEVAAVTKAHESGLLVPPGSGDDLARQILTLYRDPDLARRLGANARRAAVCFDRPLQVRRYEALFRALAAPHDRRAPLLKRPFDVVLSGLGLLASAPLWPLIAATIKLGDGGPVFYGQERVGKGGGRFRSWKFRSMVVGADRGGEALQARDRDPRVTRVGRWLRATALDELPQLWNILVGEMSFVGPRALVPEEIEVRGDGRSVPLAEIPGYDARHRVVPGLTGLAQVYAARDIPRRHKFKLDRLYVARQSFWLDLKLIALSFWITFRARWEHRGRKI